MIFFILTTFFAGTIGNYYKALVWLFQAIYEILFCSALTFFILFSIICASTIKAPISHERLGTILLTASETIAAARKSGTSRNTLTRNTTTSRFVKAPSFSKIAGIPVTVPTRKCVKSLLCSLISLAAFSGTCYCINVCKKRRKRSSRGRFSSVIIVANIVIIIFLLGIFASISATRIRRRGR